MNGVRRTVSIKWCFAIQVPLCLALIERVAKGVRSGQCWPAAILLWSTNTHRREKQEMCKKERKIQPSPWWRLKRNDKPFYIKKFMWWVLCVMNRHPKDIFTKPLFVLVNAYNYSWQKQQLFYFSLPFYYSSHPPQRWAQEGAPPT